jgi:hypothetical protein
MERKQAVWTRQMDGPRVEDLKPGEVGYVPIYAFMIHAPNGRVFIARDWVTRSTPVREGDDDIAVLRVADGVVVDAAPIEAHRFHGGLLAEDAKHLVVFYGSPLDPDARAGARIEAAPLVPPFVVPAGWYAVLGPDRQVIAAVRYETEAARFRGRDDVGDVVAVGLPPLPPTAPPGRASKADPLGDIFHDPYDADRHG